MPKYHSFPYADLSMALSYVVELGRCDAVEYIGVTEDASGWIVSWYEPGAIINTIA